MGKTKKLYINDINNEIEKYKQIEISAQPKISIIIPAYNVQEYIADCLLSLLKQIFKDFEIIIVNDGSTDETENIIKLFEKDKRIAYFKQDNKGVSSARNFGMDIAKGNFIAFIDADDWVSPNYIDKMYHTIIENNCDVSCSNMIRTRKNIQKYRLNYKNKIIVSGIQEKFDICKIPNCCYVCGKMFRKELIKNYKFKEGIFFEDVVWLPEVLKLTGSLVTVPDACYYYRVNKNSIVKQKPDKKKQEDAYNAKKNLIHFANSNGIKLKSKDYIITKSIKYLFNIPIWRIKDYNGKLKFLLFGFIKLPLKNKGVF